MEQLNADLAKHAKEVHGYTEEQLHNPEIVEKVKAAIKQE